MDSINLFNTGDKIPSKYFELPDQHRLREALTVFIADLLAHDFSKLCHLMYRYDVPEQAFHQALASESIDEQASCIADLVIAREMQKVATRAAYRQHKAKQNKPIE